MLTVVTVVLALFLAATFYDLRASILEVSTNPNHRTLADRACAGEYEWRDLIRMRVEAAVGLTLPCRHDAILVLLSVRPQVTAEQYAEMMSELSIQKEFIAREAKGAAEASQAS